MRILVVNDDGIQAEGICRLAKLAAELGEVWVVAPANQCSAMSHRITVHSQVTVRSADFPVEGVTAYQVDGTPADCVKAALLYLMPEKPDIVFSGINFGYNTGFDILYSGTVGAAMEALLHGIPAIAFSNESNGIYGAAERYLPEIAKQLTEKRPPANTLWNVNFPGCAAEECRGILWERVPSQQQYYLDNYRKKEHEDGSFTMEADGIPARTAEEGTDIRAVLERYISVGPVKNNVLRP